MTPLALAFGAAVGVGASTGIFLAAANVPSGVRPRRPIREHRTLLTRVSVALGCAGLLIGTIGVAGTQHLRTSLGPTCLGAALLFALATWLILIESDDRGDPESPDEPEWWPDFERELDLYTRAPKIPARPRRPKIPAGPRA